MLLTIAPTVQDNILIYLPGEQIYPAYYGAGEVVQAVLVTDFVLYTHGVVFFGQSPMNNTREAQPRASNTASREQHSLARAAQRPLNPILNCWKIVILSFPKPIQAQFPLSMLARGKARARLLPRVYYPADSARLRPARHPRSREAPASRVPSSRLCPPTACPPPPTLARGSCLVCTIQQTLPAYGLPTATAFVPTLPFSPSIFSQ